jgi:F0F1-type ATP synthase membrane subunit c/vacuolar-type H+-ATPase subunit K
MRTFGQTANLFALLHLELAGCERCGDGFLVAVGDGAGQGIFFGGAFEPAARNPSKRTVIQMLS